MRGNAELRRGVTVVELPEVSPQEALRVHRLARELRLTDQILSVDLDTVRVVPTGPAPAWTNLDGDAVSFAYNRMPKPRSLVDIAVWLGTNAHELGHVLFSPRSGSTLMYRVLESDRTFLSGIAMIHNIVEDQRQERLILARFAPWRAYLTAALGHHLVADDDSAWLLMCGRTWLPDDVRATAKQRFVATHGQADTDRVTRLVGEYQRLMDPGETEVEEAWSILQELHRLFEDSMPTNIPQCAVMSAGEPDVDGEPGQSVPMTADEADAQPGDGDADDDAGDGDGEGDGDSTSDDECRGKGGGGDGDDDSKQEPEQSSDQSGKGAGSGESKLDPTKPVTLPDLKRALKSAAQDTIQRDDDAKDDLESIADALDHGKPGELADGDERVGAYRDVPDSARLLHREVSDALLDLKDEAEPGWNKRTDSGRLSVRRLLNPNAQPDELFDRYEPGMMDASELEVMLLLDVSGSMGSSVGALAEATWAIRHAVDDLEGRITVLTYESGPHRVFAQPDTRPDDRMFVPVAMGGTMPGSAIREAYRVLDGSDARNRLFVILTDGDWFGDLTNDELIQTMSKSGITTVCALLDAHGHISRGLSQPNYHRAEYGAVIDDPLELARLFRRVAADRISSWR